MWPALAELQDLLPGIINQLGPDNLANLKKLAETYQGGGAHRVLQTSGHCWALPQHPTLPPALVPSGLLEGPGLARGLTILRARHPLTPAARAQNVSETTFHRQPAARRERG